MSNENNMNILLKNFLKQSILYPFVWIRRKKEAYLIKHNPEKMFSIWYKRSNGKYLDINNPKTLYDKIAYMSFRTDTSKWSELADKVKVYDYVKKCGLSEILPKLYGVYNSSSDIDYNRLPKSFVLKTNNGCATNILVKDKTILNIKEVNRQLDEWMGIDYGYLTCQPHYSRIKPLILAEEYLIDSLHPDRALFDYKFYCINGEPLYVIVYTDRKPNTHDMRRSLYDMNWVLHQEYLGRYAVAGDGVERPKSFSKMIEIVRKLSSGFKFVRVDLYEVNGEPVFGEMTFTPGMQATSEEFMIELGKMIDLNA